MKSSKKFSKKVTQKINISYSLQSKNSEPYQRKSRWSNNDTDIASQIKQEPLDSDASPPRRPRQDSDSDISPPRRIKEEVDSDMSPPRIKREAGDDAQCKILPNILRFSIFRKNAEILCQKFEFRAFFEPFNS